MFEIFFYVSLTSVAIFGKYIYTFWIIAFNNQWLFSTQRL